MTGSPVLAFLLFTSYPRPAVLELRISLHPRRCTIAWELGLSQPLLTDMLQVSRYFGLSVGNHQAPSPTVPSGTQPGTPALPQVRGRCS